MLPTVVDAQEEYKKNKDLKPEDVKSLQEWVDKQPHLPKMSEFQVILFLQSCYYSNEMAKQAIDNFFTMRTLCTDIFSNQIPSSPNIQNAVDVGLLAFLPQLTPEGYVVVFAKLMDTNPDKYVYLDQVKLFDMTMMGYLQRYGTCNGFVFVTDMQGSVFAHMTKLNVTIAKKFMYYIQEAMPIRLKQIHVINVVSFIDKIMAIMKPFLKKELLEMVQFHSSSLEPLYKCVPKECLPEEYGGKAPSLKILHEKARKDLLDNAEFYHNLEAQRVDEKKRLQKSNKIPDSFGMQGTFKKLELD